MIRRLCLTLIALTIAAFSFAATAGAPRQNDVARLVSVAQEHQQKHDVKDAQHSFDVAQMGSFFPGPGTVHTTGGAAPAFNWIAFQNDSFPPQNTSTNVGSTSVGTACGALTPGTALVAGIQLFNDLSEVITPPAGWTQLGTNQTDAGNSFAWFWHVVGSSETCSYNFTWPTNLFNTWVLVSLANTNGTTPVDAASTTTPNGVSTNAVCPSTGSLSNSSSPDVLVLFMMTSDVNTLGTLAVPSDMTQRGLGTQGGSLSVFMVATKALATATSTTETITGTPASSKLYPCLLVALKG